MYIFPTFSKVEELMQIGIDPCSPTREGICPIHTAVVLESPSGPEIVARMLKYGADPNTKTSTGLSPLHIAAMWGRVDTINVLLDNGADVADKDDSDMSALDYAEVADENKYACIDALTEFRGDVKRKSACFKTKSRCCLNRIKGKKKSMKSSNFPNSKNIDELYNNPSMLSSCDTCNYKKSLINSSKIKNSITADNKKLTNARIETPLFKKQVDKSFSSPRVSISKNIFKTNASTSMSANNKIDTPPQLKASSGIETAQEFEQNLSTSPGAVIENSFFEESLSNETMFRSCNESFWNQKISSTLLEESANKKESQCFFNGKFNPSKIFIIDQIKKISHIKIS